MWTLHNPMGTFHIPMEPCAAHGDLAQPRGEPRPTGTSHCYRDLAKEPEKEVQPHSSQVGSIFSYSSCCPAELSTALGPPDSGRRELGSQSRGHGLALLTCVLNVGVSSDPGWVGEPGFGPVVEDHQFFGGESPAQEALEQSLGWRRAGTDSSVWQASRVYQPGHG